MGMFDHFPYTNFHELNLDWILQALKEIEKTMDQFVAINSLKYADPIQWSIIRQYEKNTIVIDPLTGTAYISVQAVPSGVALTNTDYWSVVFDLGSFVVRAAKNFTLRFEEATTLTATMPINEGQWVVWGDTLYRALSNIIAGDQYVIDSNIKRITVEEIKDEINQTFNNIIGALADLNTTDKSNLVNAINELVNDITAEAGYRETADNGLLENIVNESQARQDADSALSDRIDNEVQARQDADNALSDRIDNEVQARRGADNALSDRIDNADNKILTREINWFNRHFLFVGDSYGDESGEWADLIINLLNLGSRATNLCVGGASFHDPTPALQFATQIANYTGDKSKITDIVICGGLNDSISTNALDYTSVTDGMDAFNTIVLRDYPYANVSIGYIGNGDDLDPDSKIGIRTYAARQCCRYMYYNRAAVYGWNILHNVEYLLTGYTGFIGSDGVHPSAAGSSALYIGIAQALRNGSADYNYPITSIGLSNALGLTKTGDINYKIHNDAATLSARTIVFNINTGTQFTSGTSITLATFSNLYFNDAVNILCTARMYNPDIDSTPTTNVYYTPARLTFYKNQLLITILDADGTTNHIFTYNTAGVLVIADFDYVFDSMILK